MVFSIIVAIETPFDIASNSHHKAVQVFNLLVTIIFAIDIVIKLNSAYYADEFVLVKDWKKIACRYMTGELAIDIAMCINFSAWVESGDEAYLITKCFLLIRFGKFFQLYSRLKACFNRRYTQIIPHFLVMFLFCHTAASIWITLPRLVNRESYEGTWLEPYYTESDRRMSFS